MSALQVGAGANRVGWVLRVRWALEVGTAWHGVAARLCVGVGLGRGPGAGSFRGSGGPHAIDSPQMAAMPPYLAAIRVRWALGGAGRCAMAWRAASVASDSDSDSDSDSGSDLRTRGVQFARVRLNFDPGAFRSFASTHAIDSPQMAAMPPSLAAIRVRWALGGAGRCAMAWRAASVDSDSDSGSDLRTFGPGACNLPECA